jgi:hypothetical protein
MKQIRSFCGCVHGLTEDLGAKQKHRQAELERTRDDESTNFAMSMLNPRCPRVPGA